MPEGPSIVILKELVTGFEGKKIRQASGNLKTFDLQILKGKKIAAFRSWGKHFLICFEGFTIRIHFLLFGSYTINEQKENKIPRLRLEFDRGELNFYSCAIKLLEGNVNDAYDWTSDVMNDTFDKKAALRKLKSAPESLVCDALLDQNVFSGVGNIIKNEVLFRIRVHPKSLIGKLPLKKQKELIDEAVKYSFEFLQWKKEYTLREHWLAHTKKICPRDEVPFIKEHLGITDRRTFYCELCQRRYE